MIAYILLLVIISIIIWYFIIKDNFYADWYYRANYPIGSYDPARAGISHVRAP